MDIFYEYLRKNKVEQLPQLLGIHCNDIFYNFELQTFHLNERPKFFKGLSKAHQHNVFHIVFYGDDNRPNKFILNGEKVGTVPGLVVLTPPGLPHSFSPLKKGGVYSYHEITFSLNNLKDGSVFQENFTELFGKYCGVKLESVPYLLQLNKRDRAIAEYHYGRIAKGLEMVSSDKLSLIYMNIAELLFFIIEKSCAVNVPLHGETFSPYVIKAREYIEKNYIQNPSLLKISSIAGISPEHLCRRFKDCYGVTPVHYGMKLRISAAEQLLLNSNLTISEISSRLGFADIYTFSKAFKRALGVPPGAFRDNGTIE